MAGTYHFVKGHLVFYIAPLMRAVLRQGIIELIKPFEDDDAVYIHISAGEVEVGVVRHYSVIAHIVRHGAVGKVKIEIGERNGIGLLTGQLIERGEGEGA